jgi:hypothetical protein
VYQFLVLKGGTKRNNDNMMWLILTTVEHLFIEFVNDNQSSLFRMKLDNIIIIVLLCSRFHFITDRLLALIGTNHCKSIA